MTTLLSLRVLLVAATGLLVLTQLSSSVSASACSQKDLQVFAQVTKQVAMCTDASGLDFAMPPQMSLPVSATAKLCKTPSCAQMLGTVDDLTLPRCDIRFDNRNVTLQTGLDEFASLCDKVGPAPAPLKKRTSPSSSSSSSGANGSKRKETKSRTSDAPRKLERERVVKIMSIMALAVAATLSVY